MAIFPRRAVLAAFITGDLLLSAVVASAIDSEAQCASERIKAAARFTVCHQKAEAKLAAAGAFVNPVTTKFENAISKCRNKYTATWARIQARAAGSGASCSNPRFLDNADGTTTDRLTGLQWEQKTDDGGIHDKDDVYEWSANSPFTAADGPAYTSFLTALNGACFAGQCDWRLPTIAELWTILLDEPYPCPTTPCIDTSFFGPTVAATYWTSTACPFVPPTGAYTVLFSNGFTFQDAKTSAVAVRAVRGGL
jgi:hypothetical protein